VIAGRNGGVLPCALRLISWAREGEVPLEKIGRLHQHLRLYVGGCTLADLSRASDRRPAPQCTPAPSRSTRMGVDCYSRFDPGTNVGFKGLRVLMHAAPQQLRC
jgi:hypothetical protein